MRRTYQRGWILIVVLVAAALVALALWHASRARCFVLVGDVTCRVETRERIVALSFDDGPTPEGLAAVLPVLRTHDAKATFFLIGGDMEKRPGLARTILAAGHEIGNHSYSHRRMMGLFPGDYRAELARTNALLRREGGSGPLLFRPPYGKKLTGLPLAVHAQGMRMVTWDVEEPAGQVTDPQAYAHHILSGVRPGSIILMHPMYRGNATARAALPLVLEGLRRDGYRVVGVSELLAHARP